MIAIEMLSLIRMNPSYKIRTPIHIPKAFKAFLKPIINTKFFLQKVINICIILIIN